MGFIEGTSNKRTGGLSARGPNNQTGHPALDDITRKKRR